MNGELEELSSGQVYRFADWPSDAIPSVAAGAYTVWEGDKLIYAGMAGRSLTADSILEHRNDPTTVTGLRSRLASHASGRRSGDQFCVYVADRLVLPRLDQGTIQAVGDGTASLDSLVREYIHDRLAYRFIETADGDQARALEDQVCRGGLAAGPPALNPRAPLNDEHRGAVRGSDE